MTIRTDCRRYRTDRPCAPHKETGVKCTECLQFDPIESRVLLIKLGAMGDVLRTTSILPAIREQCPGMRLTWLTGPASREVLEGIDSIDRLWVLGPDTLAQLQVERFDWAINLDLSPESLALASLARAGRKSGFDLTESGAARPCSPEAQPYLDMSHWDDLKKQNAKTYQRLMLDILGSAASPGEILIPLSAEAKAFAETFARNHSIQPGHPIIGLNLGAAGRWRWKRWTPEGFLELGKLLWDRYQARLLILSGPNEERLKANWMARSDFPAIDAGHNNPYGHFAALVNLCDLVVTGDTLALHVALGLKKKVVALFGPTSMAEVELYERGIALAGDVPCLCCYHSDCSIRPSCMESLEAASVLQAVERLLSLKS